jgi:anaerobic selenocysteine-containing dehydrogenase
MKSMTTKREGASDARRDFLKLAGLAAVGGGAMAATGEPAAAASAPEGGTSGYRETDHVKTYYKLARF